MALDTQAKRHSAMQAFSPTGWRVPLPDGEVGADDRQTLAWQYGGILSATLELIDGAMRITFRAFKPMISWVESQPTIGWVAKKPTITFHEEG